MATAGDVIMSSKFRGCLLGCLVGDCLGYPYELQRRPSAETLQKFFDDMDSSSHQGSTLPYTDDTAMTICIAESLIQNGGVNRKDLARRFVKEYYGNPDRCYGSHVVRVFAMLRANNCKDHLGPAREQFQGSGSYGNGGAMRIAPIALFFRGQGSQTLSRETEKVTQITHTHRNGINGAILQCLAVEQALWLSTKQPLDTCAFLEELIDKMQLFESGTEDEIAGSDEEARPFTHRLQWILELLQREKKQGSKKIDEEKDVISRLGCGETALTSVPTAIFCFLRAQQGYIPNIETSNPLRRSIQYAVSLGGDTDTIAAMAGALSGALLGFSPQYFNKNMLKKCEGVKNALHIADQLLSKSGGTLEEGDVSGECCPMGLTSCSH